MLETRRVAQVVIPVALFIGTGAPALAQGSPYQTAKSKGKPAATAAKDDGQWTMPGKDYGSTRFSGLSQITAANATRLRPVWSFSTGVLGGHEGQPLVVNNVMYVVTPYPNVVYAFDLTK